jgi:hypothetical protein
MTIKQAYTIFAAVHRLGKKMNEEDQEVLFLDMLEHVIKQALGKMPTLQEQQEVVAAFFIELSHDKD